MFSVVRMPGKAQTGPEYLLTDTHAVMIAADW